MKKAYLLILLFFLVNPFTGLTQKVLPIPGDVFEVDGRQAFLILPKMYDKKIPVPWVWYAPTLQKLPAIEEKWMFEKFLDAGIAVAGIDVGESYGNPEGRAHYTEFYKEMVNRHGLAKKACLLARSRGGLMLYNWAAENPMSIACIAGIYPVGNLSSWPGLDHACPAYNMTRDQLASELSKHNPIDRLEPLANAKVPIFHIHGDQDDVVPLNENSAIVKKRYEKLGGQMTLEIVEGQGHNMWPGWFKSQKLVDFVISNARQDVASEQKGILVTELKCEYFLNPIGIDVAKPRLSWIIRSGKRGQKQTAYQILVASTPENLERNIGDRWDTGKSLSDQSIQNAYEGTSLHSGEECYWKVKIWDVDGNPSKWSKPAKWSMGLLQPDDWKAKWIGSGKKDTSPWYRHQFNLVENPEKAMVYLASLGYYELYINGHKIGNEVLAPAVSNFSKRCYYQTFDISPYLTKGENCIAIWMGQGWYSPGLPGVNHHSPVVRAQINMSIVGQESFVSTDTSWLSHPSSRSLLGSWRWGDFGGELLDARLHKKDWNLVNASTVNWESTVEIMMADVPCKAQDCSGNVAQIPIRPVSVELLDSSKILVDFGTNLTGLIQMKFRNLKPGQKITMYYADMDARNSGFMGHGGLMKDGFSVLGQYDEFISAGTGDELFTNVFNYHAFRYTLIEGLSYVPEKEDIAVIPVSGKLDVVGSFNCSNELYNRINDMVVWTYSCLNLGGQTVDCPHRERLGYGDGQTIMDLGCYNYYAPDVYSKWSRNWWDEQTDDGFVPFTAPCPHNTGGGPAWGAMCIMVPWKTYLFYDDQRLLEEGYPYMKKYIDYLNSFCDDGILRDIFPGEKWPNLGDWVPPGRGMDKQDWVDDSSRRFFNNCYRVHLLQIMQKVAGLLGKNEDVTAFDKDISLSQKRIHEAWFDPDENTYANGEQPYLIFPLLTGVTPEAKREAVFDKYTETLLETDKGHLNTGMIGTQIMTDYLLEINRNDLVDTYVNQKTYPGWGYMVENGATTCGEQWNLNYSQIHSCFPYIGGWFYKGLAGIQWDTEAPGFKNVILRPGLVNSVDWVECSYESPYGKIVSNWKTDEDHFEWQVAIPPNCTATVSIPGDKIKEGGKKISRSENITFLYKEDYYSVFKVESGEYFFSSKSIN